ncbi:MAG TPA: hypothetical protein PJ986_16685 [Gammaproteobacteria bacterium]|nr:hypothetical protein [Gammaproteobacteria bacterium]
MTPDWPTLPGLHDREFELADGSRVRATLALPAALASAAPLVLCLHYGGTPEGWYGRPLLETLIAPAWRALDAVTIAPVARDGGWTNPGDTARALELLAAVAARYGCGPRLITGYSLGAIGTWHLINRSPEEFVAAVPIAGPPPVASGGATPVRALHSTSDRVFAADATLAAVRALAARGRDAACVLVDGVDHYAFGGYADALSALVPWLAARCAGR